MRLLEMPSSLISLVTALTLLQPTLAGIIPDLFKSFEDLQNIEKRCTNPCGYYGQVCCGDSETCYTDANNQAACSVGAPAAAVTANGQWVYSTTTFLQTDLKTVTQTYSSFVASQTSDCQYSMGESPCNGYCCKSGQYCADSGYCAAVPGGSSGYVGGLYTVTTVVTNTAPTAAGRPTSNAYTTVTQTGTATGTTSYVTPSGTGGAIITNPTPDNGGGGLSGGAIAGIVIGVIAALIILILICLCCCAKGILDGILALFGLGPRKKRRTEEVEVYESRHRHGSKVSDNRRTWFGTRPGRGSSDGKKKSGWGAGATVATFLGGLALILGLKRSRDKKHEKSDYGSSYYSDYTSSSESSSDRRTRRSSRSRSRAASRASRR